MAWKAPAHSWSSLNVSNCKGQRLFPLASTSPSPVSQQQLQLCLWVVIPLSLSYVSGWGIQPRLKPVGILHSLDVND